MDFYCFVEWEEVEEGKVPKLPEEIPFLLLAGTPEISNWSIFECDLPEDFEFSDSVEPVPEEIELLLFSARGYPPAIALTRDDVEEFCLERTNISKEEFSDLFKRILKQHLELQRFNQYFLAEAAVDEEDYLVKEAFYWVVGYDQENNEVQWVSDDYYLYQNPISDFLGLDSNKLTNWFLQ